MLKISEAGKEEDASEKLNNFPYRQAVEALLYLMLGSRPNLAFSVGFLSRSLEKPTSTDISKLKHVFRYIPRTTDMGIM